MNKQPSSSVTPAPIMQLSTAYWGSQTLFTANRLGLFALLEKHGMDTDSIATALNTPVRQTSLLLKACMALGLLETEDGMYRNSVLSATFLVPGKQAYMGNAISYSDNLYQAWGGLEQSLKTGQPAMPAENYLGKDAGRTRHFVYGMHNRALGIGAQLVEMVDLSSRRRMLDIGGGPGTYAAMFCRKFPDLAATVLDLPAVVELAEEILDGMPGGERVSTLAGDYHDTAFPADNDVALISGVLHRETEHHSRLLINRAVNSLVDGGLLLVSDVFTDEDGGPAFAALFGLNMMLSAPDGGVHADVTVAGWMRNAGLRDVTIQPFAPPMPHRLLVGKK